MLNIIVERNKKSFDFKVDKRREGSFSNNYKNNSIDWFCLYDDNAELARFKCQSVANYCFGDQLPGDTVDYGDTIHEGYFTINCFVPPRSFHGEIHGITETRDIDGQWIDRDSMQTTANGFQIGRFLIHDRYSEKLKRDTNYAWSAGCIILSSDDLACFNNFLHSYNVKAGTLITGQIVEV